MTNTRILPFLEYDMAYRQHKQMGEALDGFLQIACPDNMGVVLETPFQKVLEEQLARNDKDLWDWYVWYVWEADDGQAGYEFWIGGTEYNTNNFESLEDFLNFICQEYPLE